MPFRGLLPHYRQVGIAKHEMLPATGMMQPCQVRKPCAHTSSDVKRNPSARQVALTSGSSVLHRSR